MSDPQGKGFLDKQGFFVALKLIALQQNGKELTLMNMSLDVLPPQMVKTKSKSLYLKLLGIFLLLLLISFKLLGAVNK